MARKTPVKLNIPIIKWEMDMRKALTLGTARITRQPTYWLLEYMNTGSFIVGERTYSTLKGAHEFCCARKLQIIEIL